MTDQEFQTIKAKIPGGAFLQDSWSKNAHLYIELCPTLRSYLEFQLLLSIEWHKFKESTCIEENPCGWTKKESEEMHRRWWQQSEAHLESISKVKDKNLEAWAQKKMWTTWYCFHNTK